MNLGMLLMAKLSTFNNFEWKYLQEQIMSIVILHLQPLILKQMKEYNEITQ